MPTLDQIQNFISNLGFPIFMALYFMYAQQKAEQRHQSQMDKISCIEDQLLETKLQVGQVLNPHEPTEGAENK
jgi:preprotein translocase subunit YajC